MFKRIAFAAVLTLVLTLLLPLTAHAGSFGFLTGYVTGTNITYGPGGMINTIEVEFLTTENQSWSVMCRRSKGNLGLCNGPFQMALYVAEGNISSCFVLEATALRLY